MWFADDTDICSFSWSFRIIWTWFCGGITFIVRPNRGCVVYTVPPVIKWVVVWYFRLFAIPVCNLLLSAGPIEGCSAVLVVRTVAVGAWFVPSWCAQKKQVQKQNEKNRKTKTKGGEQNNSLGTDPEKIKSPSAITGWGLRGGYAEHVLWSRRDPSMLTLGASRSGRFRPPRSLTRKNGLEW